MNKYGLGYWVFLKESSFDNWINELQNLVKAEQMRVIQGFVTNNRSSLFWLSCWLLLAEIDVKIVFLDH